MERKDRKFYKRLCGRRKIITAAVLCAVVVVCIFVMIEKRGMEDKSGGTSGARDGEREDAAEGENYDIPVSEEERKEAEYDCRRMMELVADIYGQAEREDLSDVILSDEAVLRMQDIIKETGSPVTTAVLYSDMENHRAADRFLQECEKGECGSLAVYKIRYDGGIGRSKFIFDGRDMYVLTANAVWSMDGNPRISNISCAKIDE